MKAPQFPDSDREVYRVLAATKRRNRRLLITFAVLTVVIYGLASSRSIDSGYVVVLILLYCFGFGPYLTVKWQRYRALLGDLKLDCENRAVLNSLFTEGRPYALYLRQFDPERVVTDYVFPTMYSPLTGGRLVWERDLLRSLAQILPVFAFTNCHSFSSVSGARRVAFADSNWKEALHAYGASACLIVIYLDRNHAASGIAHEIAWLESQQLWGRTALVIKEPDRSATGAALRCCVANAKWVVSAQSFREGALPHDMAELVQGAEGPGHSRECGDRQDSAGP